MMTLKRQFGEEGSDNSPTSNQPLSPSTKFRKVVNHVLKELSLQEIVTKTSAVLEPTLRRVVKEEVESLIGFLQSSPRHSLIHQPESSVSRDLQLLFINKLPSTLFTNTTVRDIEHGFLQIMLVDARSKNLIQHGLLSSLKVEILVLCGDFAANGKEDWTETEFSHSLVREREGKRPLLVGDLSFSLDNGIGLIGNVVFTDNSSWVRSRKFRLGIRAVPSASSASGIREAVSEAFVVLDHRGESYQKHDRPSLDDPVWRLKKISKMGASHTKLDSLGIKTVKDFLKQYHINPSLLRCVLGKAVPNRSWETMVKHANGCPLDNTLYSYSYAAERVELLFNCVYKVIAVKFDGIYQPVDAIDARQKALVDELKQLAFLNQNEMVPINGSSATPPLASSTTSLSIPFSGANLDLHHDVDQGGSLHQPNLNPSESASYPCTIEDGYDSTAQSDQHPQGFSPTALWMGDSTSAFTANPSNRAHNWYQQSPIATFIPNNQFGQLAYPQTSTLVSFSATPMAANSHTITDILSSDLPSFGVNNSGNRKPKARWCKIRAAVMWKIVRRKVAARRKGKFPIFEMGSSFCV